jgi:hypothetical protein
MRPTPRKLRPFRPSTLTLESICPVSSLATALPPVASAVAGEWGTPSTRPHQPERSVAAAFSSMRPTPIVAGTPGSRGVGGGPDLATPSRTTLTANPGSAVGVDLGRYNNAITVASANRPPGRPSAAPAPNQDTGGGGGISSQGQPAATPPPAVVASSPSAGSTAVSSPQIRPMTLAATPMAATSSTPSATATTYDTSMSASTPSSTSDSTSGSGSDSGSPAPPPYLYISGGSGKEQHDTSSNLPPVAVQGSSWSGAPTLQGSTAGSWQILTYKWTFPSGAVKGYGTFQTKTDDPTGPYTTFSAAPTSAKYTNVEVQGFSDDDLTNQQGAGITDPDTVNSFYWGPSATGLQTVSISAFIKNPGTGATMTVTSSSQTNVVQPLGTMTTALGRAGLSTGTANYKGAPYIGIDNRATFTTDWFGNLVVTANTPGIQGQATIKKSSLPAGVSGQFAVVQTITTRDSETYDGAYTVDTQSRQLTLGDGTLPNGPSLDGLFPYSDIGTAPGTSVRDPGFSFEDIPASPLNDFPWRSTPISRSRGDSFTDTLMFNPGGIWVPVGSLTWQWSASANYDTTTSTWVQAGASQTSTPYVPASGNGDFPVWSHNIQEQLTWTRS